MSPTTVTVLQHISCETPGTIQQALAAHQLSARFIRPFAGDPVPAGIGDAAGLIVMGGPMGVYEQDQYPHLAHELRVIESALKANRPILGICLGSQLLAAALGAPVTKGQRKELGWYPIHLTSAAKTDALLAAVPDPLVAFHWHGDVFPLPSGAVHLASSELTAVQAFRYGANAYGFLCHLEVDEPLANTMIATFKDELVEVGGDPDPLLIGTKQHAPTLQRIAPAIWSAWIKFVAGALQPSRSFSSATES